MQRIDVVAAVIIRDGRILLTQRKRGKSLAYKWNVPGGKVERNESHWDAIQRECREEIGATVGVYDVAPLDIQPFIMDVTPQGFRVYHYRISLGEGTPEPRPLEGQGLGWFTVDEFGHLELSPADEARREELVKLVRGESPCP